MFKKMVFFEIDFINIQCSLLFYYFIIYLFKPPQGRKYISIEMSTIYSFGTGDTNVLLKSASKRILSAGLLVGVPGTRASGSSHGVVTVLENQLIHPHW